MKFSIVTPSFNSEKYIANTIESVLSQSGNFEIEYFIIDGDSNDKTVEIIKDYEDRFKAGRFEKKCNEIKFNWISEKDSGMYDAIDKGFAMANGDIYAWINADDFYADGTFEKVHDIFTTFTDIKWVKGISNFIDEENNLIRENPCYTHRQDWIKKGVYGRNAYHITQDSVFWISELWKKTGSISPTLKYAGDYELWIKMSNSEKLWSVNSVFSFFRKRQGQLSKDVTSYRKEQQKIYPQTIFSNFSIRLFFNLESRLRVFQSFFLSLYKYYFINSQESFINETPLGFQKKTTSSYIVK